LFGTNDDYVAGPQDDPMLQWRTPDARSAKDLWASLDGTWIGGAWPPSMASKGSLGNLAAGYTLGIT